MNYLEKLLDGAGVEWKALGAVCRFINGRAYKQPELLSQGKYPVLRVGNFFTNDNWYYSNLELDEDKYCDKGDLLYAWSASFGPRIWGGNKVIYHYHIWKVVPDADLIHKKFLYYLLEWDTKALKEENGTGSTMMHVGKGSIEKRLVPIPCPDNPKKSLEIQAEIVRILDAFTQLTSELTSELTTRRKQYNYYRDKLLSFKEGGVEWKTLGEVCRFINGRAYKQPELLEAGKYPVLRVGNFFTNGNWYYSNLELEEDKYCDKGDLLYAWSASFGPKIWGSEKVIFHYHIWKVMPNADLILKKYLFYLLAWDTEALKAEHGTGSTMMHIGKGAIEKRLVPVPSLAEQAHIVAILDKFDALTNSISEGLPREIALRQKQYEYYRDLLLRFPKPAAEISRP